MTSKKTSKRAFTLAATILMVAMALAGLGAMQAHNQPAMHASPKKTAMADATTATTYQAVGNEPNPVLNSNVTWSTFYSGWSPLEYNTGSENTTLNASLNPSYVNPISINPSNIIAPGTLQNNRIGTNGYYWNASTVWIEIGNSTSTTASKFKISAINASGRTTYTISAQTNYTTGINIGLAAQSIPIANYPSNNLAYDYLTMSYSITGKALTGVYANLELGNSTGKNTNAGAQISPGQTNYISESLQQLQSSSWHSNITAGNGYSSEITPFININFPKTTDNYSYNISVNAFAFTESPYYLGNQYNATNSTSLLSSATGQVSLQAFDPTFTYEKIINNGYTAAVRQTLQNVSISQAAISNGQYIEQVTYQGFTNLPNAPDLSYANTNISMAINIPGNQFIVANVNGISYTTTIHKMTNGTMYFGSVNPNNANNIILQIEYTAAQWNGISGVPGFWSNPLGYLEYYWYITLGALVGAIGLGAGMSAKAEGFRVAKK